MKRTATILALFTVAATAPILLGARAQQPAPAHRQTYRGWPAYGGGPEQIRYSRLDQINRANVKQLEQAWIYDSGETGGLQTQPIVVDGVLYGVTPTHKTFALRAATGEHLWTFDSGIKAQGPNRGVMYWSDGSGDRRVFAAVEQLRLRARRARPASRSRPSATAAGSICTAISDAIPSGSRSSSPRRASSTRIC